MKHIHTLPALLLAAILPTGFEVCGDTNIYFFEEIAEVMGVADNGRYVAISDIDNLKGYIWTPEDPGHLKDITVLSRDEDLPSGQRITGVAVMDLTDDGMAVGSVYYKDGKQKAAYWKDGEWIHLPLHEAVLNNTCAVAVTPDGSVIGGFQFVKDETADIAGRYYPSQWFRQEDGSYEMVCYTDIELPDHQGFYTQTQSPDGRVLGGTLYCGAGSTVPALIVEGKLVFFNTLETRVEEFEYKGEVIGYFKEEYIDGYKDGATGDFFTGGFDNCDASGNFYGSRTRVEDLNEETGEGTLVRSACIYNLQNDEWDDDPSLSLYTAGIGDSLLFTGKGEVIKKGRISDIREAYGIETDHHLTAIGKISADGNVLGGMYEEVNPATGENTYYPFIIDVDRPQVSVSAPADDMRMDINVGDGRIGTSAGELSVWSVDGRLIATGREVSVAPGLYLVGNAGKVVKILIP